MAPETVPPTTLYHAFENNADMRYSSEYRSPQQPPATLWYNTQLEIRLLPQVRPALLATERIAAATKWHAVTRQWTLKFNQFFAVYKRAAAVLGERARKAYQDIFNKLQALVARLVRTFDALQALKNTKLLTSLTQERINRAMRLCLVTSDVLTEQISMLHAQIDACERDRVEILNRMLCAFIECVRPYAHLSSTIGSVDAFRDRQVMMFDQTLLCNQRAIASFLHHIELCLVRFKMRTHVLSRTIVHEWKQTKFAAMVGDFMKFSSISADALFAAHFGRLLSTLTHSYKTEVVDACHVLLAELPCLVGQSRESTSIDAIVGWWRKAFAVTHTHARKLVFDDFLLPIRSDITNQLADKEQTLVNMKNAVVAENIYTTDELFNVQQNRLMLDECVKCIAKQRVHFENMYETFDAALSAVLHRNKLRVRAAFTFAFATVATWQSYMLALRVAHQSLQLYLQLERNKFISNYHIVMLALDLALDRMQHARSLGSLQRRKQHALRAAQNIVNLHRILFESKLSKLMDFYPRIVERQSRIYLERLCRIFQLCMPWWWRVRTIVTTKPTRRTSTETDGLSGHGPPSVVVNDDEESKSAAELRDFAVFLRQQNLIDNDDAELFTGSAGALYHNIGQMLAESELLTDWMENQNEKPDSDADESTQTTVDSVKGSFLQDVTDLLQQHHTVCAPLYPETETDSSDKRRSCDGSRSGLEASDSATKLTPLDEERWHVGSVENVSAIRDEDQNLDDFLKDIANLFSTTAYFFGNRSKRLYSTREKRKLREDFAAGKADESDSSDGANFSLGKALQGAADDNRHLSLPSTASRNTAFRGRWAAHATRSFESLEIILHSAAPNVLRLRRRYGILLDFATIISLRDQSIAARRRTPLTLVGSESASPLHSPSPNVSRAASKTRRAPSKQRVASGTTNIPLDSNNTRTSSGNGEAEHLALTRKFNAMMNRAVHGGIKRGPHAEEDNAQNTVLKKNKVSKSSLNIAGAVPGFKHKKSAKSSRQKELPLESSDDEVNTLSSFPWTDFWTAEFGADKRNEPPKPAANDEFFHSLLASLNMPVNVDMFIEIERETGATSQSSATPDLLDNRSRAYYAALAATSIEVLQKCSVIINDGDNEAKCQNTDKVFFPNERRLHQVRHFERWRAKNGGGRYDPVDKNLLHRIWPVVSSTNTTSQQNLLTSLNEVAEHFLVDNRRIESLQHEISEAVLENFVFKWWPNTVKRTTYRFVVTWKQHLHNQIMQFHGGYWLGYQKSLIDYVYENRMHFIRQHEILRKLYFEKANRCTSSAKQTVRETVSRLRERIDRLQQSITEGTVFQRATVACQQQSSLDDLLRNTRKRIESFRIHVLGEMQTLVPTIRTRTTCSVLKLNRRVMSELRILANIGRHEYTEKEVVDIGRFLSAFEDKMHTFELVLHKEVSAARDQLAQITAQTERICNEQFQQFEHELQMTVFAKNTLRRMQYAVQSEAKCLKESFERIQDTRTECDKQIFMTLPKVSSDPLKLANMENNPSSLTGITQVGSLVRMLVSLCKKMQNVAEFIECKQRTQDDEIPTHDVQNQQKAISQHEISVNVRRPVSATTAKSTAKSSPELPAVTPAPRPASARADDRRSSACTTKPSLISTSSTISKPRIGMAFVAQLSILAMGSKHALHHQQQNKARRSSREPRPSASTASKSSHAIALDNKQYRLQSKQSEMYLRSRGSELAFKKARCLLLGLPPPTVEKKLADEIPPHIVPEVVHSPEIVRKSSTATGSPARFSHLSSRRTVLSTRWSETHKKSTSQFTRKADFQQSLSTLTEEKEGRSSRDGSTRFEASMRKDGSGKKSTEYETPEQIAELDALNNKNVDSSNKLAFILTNEDPLRDIPKRIVIPKNEQYDITERVELILHPPSDANQALQNPTKRQNTSGSVLEKYMVLGSDEVNQGAVPYDEGNFGMENKKSRKLLPTTSSRPATAGSKAPVSIVRLNVIQEQESTLKVAAPVRRQCASPNESDEDLHESADAAQKRSNYASASSSPYSNVHRPDSAPAALSPDGQHEQKSFRSYRDTILHVLRQHYNRLLLTYCNFYDFKTSKRQQILRKDDLPQSFEACAATLVKTAHSYLEQSNRYHEDCANLLVDEARHCELLLCRAPAAITNAMTSCYSAHISARIHLMLFNLRAHVHELLAARRQRRRELTTSLGHPSNKHLLESIADEEMRSSASICEHIHREVVAIWQTYMELTRVLLGKIQETAHNLIESCADKLVCADEIVTYWSSSIAEQQVFWKYLEKSIAVSQSQPAALLQELHTRRAMSFPRIVLYAPPLRVPPDVPKDNVKSGRMTTPATMGDALSVLTLDSMKCAKYQHAEENEIKAEDEEERGKFKVKITPFEKVFEADEHVEGGESERDSSSGDNIFVCFRGYRTQMHTNLGHVAIFLAVCSVVKYEKSALAECARKMRRERGLLLDAALQEELLWEDDLAKINDIFKVAEIYQNI